MTDLDLAALLVSRVCHDLAGPVGAVMNGLEVLADEDDEKSREQALKVILSAAEQAAAKLQFARLAFGASSSRGDFVPTGDVRFAVEKLFAGGKMRLDWRAPDIHLFKREAKVLAGLSALAAECLKYGGTVSVSGENNAGVRLAVRAQGKDAKLSDEFRTALLGGATPDLIDGRAVLPLMLGLFVRADGGSVVLDTAADSVTFAVSFPRAKTAASGAH